MIRRKGWLIILGSIVGLLLLAYLLAGTAIRLGLIYALEDAVGAEVNIGKVSVQLAPVGVTIDKLQITDPAKPDYNSISFAQAKASVELWPAIKGYYIVNELAIDGMTYGQKRDSTGQVYRQPVESGTKLDLAQLLNVDLPSTDELLARANLKTVEKGQALQQLAKQEQQALEALKSNLPDKNTVAQYQADIKALTDSKIEGPADLAAKTEQFKVLQDKIKAEKAKLQQIQQQLGSSKEKLQLAVTELKQASDADWQQLQQLANLSDGGLVGISQILLGDAFAEQIAQLQSLYLLAKPYIDDFKNKPDEPAKEVDPNQPYPDFWVKNARINWLIGGGETTLTMQDITAQHQLIDAVTRFNLDVGSLPQLAKFSLNGDFAVLEQMIANASWQLDGLNLQPQSFGKGDTVIDIANALLNTSGSLKLTDNTISQQATVLLKNADFATAGNKYLQQLVGLLNNQQQIPFTIATSGLLTDPKVSIRSSLDKMLGDALLGEAKQKVAAYQQELQAKLNSQLQAQLGHQNEWLALLQQQDGNVAELDGNFEQMLNAKLAGVKEQAADKLKDKLLNRLGGNNKGEN